MIEDNINEKWDSYTIDEKSFWVDCQEIVSDPEDACDEILEKAVSDDCSVYMTVGECFDYDYDLMESLDENE